MEKIKTIILIILVSNSLFLTGTLIFYSPNSDSVSLSEYLPRIQFGQNVDYQLVLKPKEMIYHFGDNIHSLAKPNTYPYSFLEKDLENWSFFNISIQDNEVDWVDTVENKLGIEVVFANELPHSLIASIFKIYETDLTILGVNRLWITSDNEENIITYFISDKRDQVYAAQTSITNDKLIQYITQAEGRPLYQYYLSSDNDKRSRIAKMYYLPIEGVEFKRVKSSYISIAVDDFKQLLFIDPNLAKIYELDNSGDYLYTDGTRSMQFFSEKNYISYFQPLISNQKEIDLESDLYLAIRYINQHGGWDGYYQLQEIRELDGGTQTLLKFQQYLEGIPLLEQDNMYGTINMQVTDGIVSSLKRSVILADKVLERKPIKTLTNSQMISLLQEQNISMDMINTVDLVYKAVREQDHIIFDPYWIIGVAGLGNIEIVAYGSVVQSIGLE